jgi:hypothetical protein
MARSNSYGQRNDGGWCQCAECDRTFTGLTGFDAHRSAEHPDGSIHGDTCNCSNWWPRCLTDAELGVKGYAPDVRGWWGTGALRGHWVPAERTQTAAAGVDP